ncbi:MAG TPA: flagellar assembly protein FliW [Bacteriovoracaceae bacterium]|nr:flagellar assembly protein FliW [Bacteriovoracaceae bacterium]
MKVKTTRFGELEVNPGDVLTFAEGLLGFENLKKYFVVDPGDSTLILWLQSTEDEKVAFPIIEPKIFKPDYIAKLLPADLNGLELESLSNAKLYSILTIPSNVVEMSANLKAPLVINSDKKVGKQIVLQDSKLSVKHEMYKELKTYIVNYSSDDARRTNVEPSIALESGDLKPTPQVRTLEV